MRAVTALLSLMLVAGALNAQDAYEIGPGDVLRIVVLGQAEMTGQMPVDSEGMLTFPVLGKIKASAMTTKELERKLTTLLADGYLRRPDVSVSVHEYLSQQVYVSGEVQKPGRYALKTDRTLLALLGEVGTLTANAGHEILVVRGSKGAPAPPVATPAATPESSEASESPEVAATPEAAPGAEIVRVSLADLRSGRPEANVVLQAGDTVHVPRASQIYVTGRVARPGAYRYEAGTTVLQAVTLAGGVTERGSSKRVKLIRVVDGKKQQVKVKLTDPVAPEDTLIVPESFF